MKSFAFFPNGTIQHCSFPSFQWFRACGDFRLLFRLNCGRYVHALHTTTVARPNTFVVSCKRLQSPHPCGRE